MPRVLDSRGAVLTFGSRVRSAWWGEGTVTGLSMFTHNASGMTAFVVWDDHPRNEVPCHCKPTDDLTTYRCDQFFATEPQPEEE